MKIKLEDLKAGQKVYICDYRQEDLNKKPIRNVQPMTVQVVSNDDLPKNKTVYYSDVHFRMIKNKGEGVTSRIIPPFDNTGYRSYPGKMLNIFDNYQECADLFKVQIDDVIERLEHKKEFALISLQQNIDAMIKLKANK
jgi:hypothetical protein|tara:strand:- start:62 stop:478 length:417 start_codon:yes stop_codon:yes gene_type:complete